MYQQEGKRNSRSVSLSPKVVAGIVLAILALIFVFQNTNRGRVHFFFWNLNAPIWMWLIILLAVGFVLGSLFPWFRRVSKD